MTYSYKLLSWIDENNLWDYGLSLNPKGIDYLEKNKHRINWANLSMNKSAIHILRNNKHKIVYEYLILNENNEAIKLVQEKFHLKKNQHIYLLNKNNCQAAVDYLLEHPSEINWYLFMSNFYSADYILLNQFTLIYTHTWIWEAISGNSNPKLLPLMKENESKLNWTKLSRNPLLFEFLKTGSYKKFDKINWSQLCLNPDKRAIELLKLNQDKIDWSNLSSNENAISLLKKNQDKINWKRLSANSNAISILKKNQDKIHWTEFSKNPAIFKFKK